MTKHIDRTLYLLGAREYPVLRDVLAATAAERATTVEEIEIAAWGRTHSPWIEVVRGRVRAGLTMPDGQQRELAPGDVLWALEAPRFDHVEDPYLRAEHQALTEGFFTLCPARSVNRRGLRSPLWTSTARSLLVHVLTGPEARPGPLRAPAFHLGRPDEQAAAGRRYAPWPGTPSHEGRGGFFWLPSPGVLHTALVAGAHAVLARGRGEGACLVEPSSDLAEALVHFARTCGGDYLELLLAPIEDGAREAWVVLNFAAEPVALEHLAGAVPAKVREALVDPWLAEMLGGAP